VQTNKDPYYVSMLKKEWMDLRLLNQKGLDASEDESYLNTEKREHKASSHANAKESDAAMIIFMVD